jgi:hypothetical protein
MGSLHGDEAANGMYGSSLKQPSTKTHYLIAFFVKTKPSDELMGVSYFVAAADAPGSLMVVLCLGLELVSLLPDRTHAFPVLFQLQDELIRSP